MAGVWFGHGLIGQIQLVETVIFHRPKHIPPSRIERLWALIALGAPVLKGVFGMGRIANGCIVAIILIVGLPCGNAGVRAIAFGHEARDPSGFVSVGCVAKTIMAPRAKFADLACAVAGQHVWIFVEHPARRGGGGCAQNNLEPGSAQSRNCAVQPAPVKLPRLRLKPRPSKFANPHPSETGFNHLLRIKGPNLFGPMLWIVTNSEAAFHWDLTK